MMTEYSRSPQFHTGMTHIRVQRETYSKMMRGYTVLSKEKKSDGQYLHQKERLLQFCFSKPFRHSQHHSCNSNCLQIHCTGDGHHLVFLEKKTQNFTTSCTLRGHNVLGLKRRRLLTQRLGPVLISTKCWGMNGTSL